MKKLIGVILIGLFSLTTSSVGWSQNYHKAEKKAQKAEKKELKRFKSGTYHGFQKKARKADKKRQKQFEEHTYRGYHKIWHHGQHHTVKVKGDKVKIK